MLGLPPQGACLLLRSGSSPRSGAAGTEVTPPTSSAASAAVLEDITDAVEMDPGLTANDAEIMYNPFDRPSGEEVVEAIPRDRSRSHSRSRSA